MSTMRTKAKKDFRVSNLRILSIILVMFAHSIIIYSDFWGMYQTNVKSDMLNYLCKFIYLFHMPLFFSISGFLAKYTYEKNANFLGFMKKKFRRLIIPCIFVGLFWLIPIRYITQNASYVNHGLLYNTIFSFLLGKDSGNLWFLQALFLIFAIHFILVKKINDKLIRHFIIVIIFVASFFLPTYLGKAAENLIWFHAGYIINENIGRLQNNKTIKVSVVLVFLVSVLMYFFCAKNILIEKGAQAISALSAIMIAYTFITNKKPNKIFEKIEKNSFGMYLFHTVMITAAFCPDIPPISMITINMLGFGLLAYIITIILRKTKAKFIIGE